MTNAKLIYQKPTNEDELRSCAVFQRKLFELLTDENGLMWDEILFPCADARSVLVAQKLNEPSVFGTHAIISTVDEKTLKKAAKSAAEQSECKVPYRIRQISDEPDSIEKALHISLKGFERKLICGDFAKLVRGCDENWKIRDFARRFLSFAETANDKTGKSFIGILGGKAIFSAGEEHIEAVSKIYTSKTGHSPSAKIHKAVRGSAK